MFQRQEYHRQRDFQNRSRSVFIRVNSCDFVDRVLPEIYDPRINTNQHEQEFFIHIWILYDYY